MLVRVPRYPDVRITDIFTCLIDPKFSDDNVVYDGLDLTPGVVVAGVLKLQMSDAERFDLQVFSLEL